MLLSKQTRLKVVATKDPLVDVIIVGYFGLLAEPRTWSQCTYIHKSSVVGQRNEI